MEPSDFFDELAEDYSDLISFDKSIQKVKENLKVIIEENDVVADIGCGIGKNTFAMASIAKEVHGFDISHKSIEKADELKENMVENPMFHYSSVLEISSKFDKKFDKVLLLGNVLPNIKRSEIEMIFGRLNKLLKKGGQIVIQLLNYEKILRNKERIVNITESSEKTFVRFYDFLDETIRFNILSFSKSDLSNRKIISTDLTPYKYSEIKKLLEQIDFKNIEAYGNIKKENFSEASNNLVVLGEAFNS